MAFTDECLIKAVELRLRRLTGAPLEAALQDADQSGYVLVRPLVAGLQKFEKAEPAMSYYFPDLITGIDFDAEHKRALGIKFAAAQPNAEADEIHGSGSGHASELERLLAEGNREIANKDAAAATATFEGALAKYPNDSRLEYGLAIASVISGMATAPRSFSRRWCPLQPPLDRVRRKGDHPIRRRSLGRTCILGAYTI